MWRMGGVRCAWWSSWKQGLFGTVLKEQGEEAPFPAEQEARALSTLINVGGAARRLRSLFFSFFF